MRRLVRRNVIRITAVVLVIAVLPSALYLGHWPFLPGYERSDSATQAQEHAGHCHVDPSRCSNGPGDGPVLPVLVDGSGFMLLAGGVLMLLDAPVGRSRAAVALRVERPPRETLASVTA